MQVDKNECAATEVLFSRGLILVLVLFFDSAYRVDQEEARTDSRWLYLMVWKAAPAKKAVRARRWDYHACDAGKALISENYRSYGQIPPPDSGPGVRRKAPS